MWACLQKLSWPAAHKGQSHGCQATNLAKNCGNAAPCHSLSGHLKFLNFSRPTQRCCKKGALQLVAVTPSALGAGFKMLRGWRKQHACGVQLPRLGHLLPAGAQHKLAATDCWVQAPSPSTSMCTTRTDRSEYVVHLLRAITATTCTKFLMALHNPLTKLFALPQK